MLKAYHQARRAADVDAILEARAILPLLYFIEPSQVRSLCKDFKRAFRNRYGVGPEPVAEEGLDAIVDEVERAIADRQQGAGISPAGLATHGPFGQERPTTGLECEDLLAGDVDRVFLSFGRWMSPGALNGFVFDAEDLVRRGAETRPEDMLAVFLAHIERVLRDPEWETPAAAREEIERGLAAALAVDEHGGEPALRRIRRWSKLSDRELRIARPEIVWRGPLPVELAVEVWKNGERKEIP